MGFHHTGFQAYDFIYVFELMMGANPARNPFRSMEEGLRERKTQGAPV